MGIAKLLRLCSISCGFSYSGIANAAELPPCPENYERMVNERVVEPATFVDILSDRVAVTEGAEIISLPAEWDWVNKPSDYVQPKFIEVNEIYVGSFKWSSAEVDVTYQAESHDVIKKLDGTSLRRVVPPIKKKGTRRFQPNPNSYFIRRAKMPFDAETMVTATKVRVQTRSSLTIDRQVKFLPKYVTDRFDIEYKPTPLVTKSLAPPEVVGRIRYPATIEQYLGDCLEAKP